MSLLSLSQSVASQTGFPRPTTVAGSTDEFARRITALANLEGKTLTRAFDWAVLQKEHTFDTADGTASYDLPADFDRFIPTTQWDRGNFWALEGPLTPQEWQTLKSGIIESTPRRKFRITPVSGVKKFTIFPTPGSVDTLVFEYVSANWIDGKSAFAADADEALIPEYLIELGVRWRLLNVLGLAYAEEKREYDIEVAREKGRDGGSRILNMGTRGPSVLNIPESGYGS